MGAGSYPVGFGPAGFDPASITPATATVGGRASLFDPFARDIPIDPVTGLYAECHPVDSQVLLALGVRRGKVLSVPGVGGTVLDLPIADSTTMTAEARRRTEADLADLIAAGDVSVESVNAWADPSYRAHVEIVYRNLRLPSQDAENQVTKLLLSGGQ